MREPGFTERFPQPTNSHGLPPIAVAKEGPIIPFPRSLQNMVEGTNFKITAHCENWAMSRCLSSLLSLNLNDEFWRGKWDSRIVVDRDSVNEIKAQRTFVAVAVLRIHRRRLFYAPLTFSFSVTRFHLSMIPSRSLSHVAQSDLKHSEMETPPSSNSF